MLSKIKKQLYKKGEIYLKIKAKPGAGETAAKDVMGDGTVKVSVAAPAVKGKANKELIKFLAKGFEVSAENVKIVSGAGERVKLVKIVK
jgi:hypothetical protein